MALLMLDLDNTLLDRTAPFRRWAGEFLRRIGAPERELAWVLELDADGFRPRVEVAAGLRRRFGLDLSVERLVAELRDGVLEGVALDDDLAALLRAAYADGWTPVLVTNGDVDQQTAKIHRSGLANLVDHWVISEEARVRKPDPAIFELAARRAGVPLAGAWMVGDAPEADIGGGQAVGAHTAWVRRERTWPLGLPYAPRLQADGRAETLRAVLRSDRLSSR